MKIMRRDRMEKARNGRELKRYKLSYCLEMTDGEKSDEDMEITFNIKPKDLSKRIPEKDKKSETVCEAVVRKLSEKKKGRKRSKHCVDDSSDYYIEDGPTGDFFVEEPCDADTNVAKKGSVPSKKQRKDAAANNDLRDIEKEQEASRVELELLMAEDRGPIRRPKGYNLKRMKGKNKKGPIRRPKGYNLKQMKGKNKKEKEVSLEDKLPDVDVRNDPRFSRCLHLICMLWTRRIHNTKVNQSYITFYF